MRVAVDLKLPRDARLISQTRRIFSGYLSEMDVDSDDVSDVVLALSEACTNVMRHAFIGADECYHVNAQLCPEEAVFLVEDRGVGFRDRSGRTMPDGAATSGRGLEIIREVMTSVEVESSPDRPGTRLHMRKSLRSAGLA